MIYRSSRSGSELTGILFSGYSGTVVKLTKLGNVAVRLDDGLLRLGYSVLTLRRVHIVKGRD